MITATRSFTLEDDSTVVYPKLPDGKSIRVVIVRRKLTSSGGTVFHVCRNAGKWSYRIDYPFKPATTRMARSRFVSELRRIGGADEIGRLLTEWN